MPDQAITWPPAPKSLILGTNEIHVWAAALDLPAELREGFHDTLSESERERAARFKFDHHRNWFIAAHGMMRDVLGRYLQCDPAAIDFICSASDKPALSSRFAKSGIEFNLTHSKDIALLAVTRLGPIGIDVEQVRAVKDVDDLVARFFSPRETGLFHQLAAAVKPAAFFHLWTRKEALLKATGEGITGSLNRVEVSFLPDEAPRLLALPPNAGDAAEWSLHSFSPAADVLGAAAIRAHAVRLQYWRWNDQ